MNIPFDKDRRGFALYITSYEMAQILSYLDSKGEMFSDATALPLLKKIPGVIKCRPFQPYRAPKDAAWEYFRQNYAEQLRIKNINTIEELIFQASMYVEEGYGKPIITMQKFHHK